MAQGPGSTRQNNGPFTVGGFYNFAPFTLVDGQACALQFDINGNLKVTSTGGGGGSNPAAGPTGAPVPADADYLGVNVSGVLTGLNGFTLTNGTTALEIALVDANGNQITSFGGGVQYAAGTTVVTPTGTVALGQDSSNVLHALRTDASGDLIVNFSAPQHVIVDSGSITVSGTVTANQGTAAALADAWPTELTDGTHGPVSVLALTDSKPLTVAIVDGNGDQITSFGGGTQYADNAASGATPTGTLSMGWDSAASKIRALKVDSSQNLLVDISNASIAVTQSTSPWVVAGNLTHNNAAPAATEIGVLPAIANAAAPTFVEGNQVLLSTDLAGTLRVNGPYQRGTNSGFNPTFGSLALGLSSGVFTALELNPAGALVTFSDGSSASPAANWNSSTTPGTTATLVAYYLNSEFYSGLVVGVDAFNGPEVGGAFIIEMADVGGDAWVPVTALILGTQQLVSFPYTPVSGTVVELAINVTANYQVRARLTTAPASGALKLFTSFVANAAPVLPVVVAGTVAVTQSTSPWVVSLTSTTITGNVTVIGAKSNNSVVPGATNLGVLPGIANAATQTWTEGDQVLESMDLSGRQRIRGTLTHNNVAPSSDLIGVMNGLANASAPTYTEGDLVLQSVDLSGNTRIVGTKTNNSAAPTTQVGVIPAVANAAAPTWTEGDQVLLSEDLSGNTRVIQPKDRGRSVLGLTYTNTANATTTTPTVLTTLVENSNYVSSTGVTAFQVPAGKTLRIQSLAAAALLNSTTAVTAIADAQSVYIEIRVSTTNTTTALSTAPIAAMLAFSLDYDVVGSAAYGERSFPDGVEVPAGDYVGITVHNAITTLATIVSGISLIGYTY